MGTASSKKEVKEGEKGIPVSSDEDEPILDKLPEGIPTGELW